MNAKLRWYIVLPVVLFACGGKTPPPEAPAGEEGEESSEQAPAAGSSDVATTDKKSDVGPARDERKADQFTSADTTAANSGKTAKAGGKSKAAGKAAGKGQGNAAPAVKAAVKMAPEGFRLGMSADELGSFYDKVLDDDYRPLYKRVSIGPELKALDAALAEQKLALRRSKVEFGQLPTGIDNTPLKGEYNYRNNEMMMSLNREGVTRYFFLFSQRVYKAYDAIPLKEGGELGATYQEAVTILSKRFGVGGRVLAADPSKGRPRTEVDWTDATMRVRAVDRSDENLVGLVFEERATADRLAAYRAQNKTDDTAVDPSIQAITKPGAVVDPNATAADAYTGRAHSAPPGPKGAAPGATGKTTTKAKKP
jgi:hypothetical protein